MKYKINSVDIASFIATMIVIVLYVNAVIDWRLFLIYMLARITFVVKLGDQ